MELQQHLRWLWVILVVIILSFIICLVFIFLNWWISRGKRLLRLNRKPEYKEDSQRYQATNIQSVKTSNPPLPSRAQFINEDQLKSQSYENLVDEQDYEDPDKNASHDERDSHVQSPPEPPDYVKVDSEPDAPSHVPAAQSYENLANEQDYEDPDKNASHDYERDSHVQSPPEPPDYVKVDSEPDAPSHVPAAQSYGNLANEQDYVEPDKNASHDYEQDSHVQSPPEPPDYVKVDSEPDAPSHVPGAQSYENLADEQNYEEPEQDYEEPEQDYEDPEHDYEDPDKNTSHDYEQDSYVQSPPEPPDYVKVDSEPDAASYEEPGDNASTEDYDDIGAEDSEDYDDVG